MNTHQKAILIILSRILDYPHPNFLSEQAVIEDTAKEYIAEHGIQKEVLKRITPLFDGKINDLQQLYVETFDDREKTNLYLTAQEFGDGRKRGVALIQLQKMIVESGFEYQGKELIDYIPMLLEFLAVAPDRVDVSQLTRRMAFAIQRIVDHIPADNPYHDVAQLLMQYVFEALGKDEILLLENEREEADLAELPYPLMYR